MMTTTNLTTMMRKQSMRVKTKPRTTRKSRAKRRTHVRSKFRHFADQFVDHCVISFVFLNIVHMIVHYRGLRARGPGQGDLAVERGEVERVTGSLLLSHGL